MIDPSKKILPHRAVLNRCGESHRLLYKWGLEHISIDNAHRILDIGDIGSVKAMEAIAPGAMIDGLDATRQQLLRTRSANQSAIRSGRVHVRLGSAEELPYEQGSFDLATAFETTYYWRDLPGCFRNIHRVLREKGAFLICNENSPENQNLLSLPELERLLREAGFRTVHTYLHPRGSWICAVGIK